MPELISSSTHKSRKEHRCDWCGLNIEKGTTYRKSLNKDGSVFTWKNHIHCDKLTRELGMWEWCDDGLSDDDFKTELIESFYEETGIKVGFKPEDISRCIDYFIKKFNIKID